ncbi:Alpha-macroglobulin receptor-binding, partial [Trinorchestia longiramus]
DSVLALQALAAYQSLHNGDLTDLTVTITKNNNLETHQVDVSQIPNDIMVEVKGSGCLVVQAVVSYSVENAQESTAMSLDVSTCRNCSDDCQVYNFNACVAYNLQGRESNMAIIEVNLVTGYTPNKEDLRSYVNENIKQYEVEGSQVIFYLNSLNASLTCVYFRAIQVAVIENPKKGTVKAYDYYEPELFVGE